MAKLLRGPTFRFDVPEVECPACGAEFTRMSVFEGDESEPEEGETMVCVACRAALTLKGQRPALLTAEEWQALPAELQAMVCRAQVAAKELRLDSAAPEERIALH